MLTIVFLSMQKLEYELALKYQKMVNNPEVGSRAALARKLGVSRAWITKVMRALK